MNKLTSKTRKALLTAGLLSGAAFATLGFTPAAKALDFLNTNLDGLAASGPFDIGDKTYSDFSFTGFKGTDTVNISELGPSSPQHTLNLASSMAEWGVGTYTLTYKMKVKAGSPYVFDAYRNQVGSAIFGTNTGTYTTAFSMLVPATGLASGPVMSTINDGPSLAATFTGEVTEAIFTNTLKVTEGGATVLDNTLLQKPEFQPPDEVPGPLPLLGAGAAFGFSRRIRNRIKAKA
jgi:hypothetical protein